MPRVPRVPRVPEVPKETRLLTRLFFGRLFENELFSSSMAAASSLIWLLAFLATPGVMFSFVMSLHYESLSPLLKDRSILGHQALLVDFAMAAAAIATMMVWSSLTPDRRDVMVLGALPMKTGQQARSRLLALTLFIGLFIVAVAGPTGVAFNILSRRVTEIFVVVPNILGHFSAIALGVSFVFFALVNVQLLVAALFGPKGVRVVAVPLQAASLLSVVAALAFIDPMVLAFHRVFDGGEPQAVLRWNPAAWFVASYRFVAGDARPIFGELARLAWIASAINVGFTLVLYPPAYGRCLRNVITSEGRRTTPVSRWWASFAARLLRPLLWTPLERGLSAFMIATFGRSQTHRFFFGLYGTIGFALSMPFLGELLEQPTTYDHRFAWFAVPLGHVFWLVTGARVAMMMPAEPVANWIFKLTEPVDKRRVLTTVVTVVAAMTVLPIVLLFSGVLAAIGETRLAVTAFLVVTLAGLCLIELLTLTMTMVPFSCTYLPGQLKLRYYWAPYFILWLNFVFTLSRYSIWALESWTNTAAVAGPLLALWIALRAWHMDRAKKIPGFIYEVKEPELMTSGLSIR